MATKKGGKKAAKKGGTKKAAKKDGRYRRRPGEVSIFTYVECAKHGRRYPKGESCPECH